MKRAVIYCRTRWVSEGRSPDLATQKERCEKFCERKHYDVIEVVVDDAACALILERPGLQQVRDLAQAGSVEAVVTLSYDRLTRYWRHSGLLKCELAEAGVAIVVVETIEAAEDWEAYCKEYANG